MLNNKGPETDPCGNPNTISSDQLLIAHQMIFLYQLLISIFQSIANKQY